VQLIKLSQLLIVKFYRESLMEEELCLMDSCTTNSILRKTEYFQTITRMYKNVLITNGRDTTIVGSGRATITFPNGTQVTIEDDLLYFDSTRTLISFKDIQKNGLYVCTHEANMKEFPLITKSSGYDHEVLERIPSTLSRLYYTYIKLIPYVAYKVIF
jgi:hypothetical protein